MKINFHLKTDEMKMIYGVVYKVEYKKYNNNNNKKIRGATNTLIWLNGDRQKLSLEHGTAESLC